MFRSHFDKKDLDLGMKTAKTCDGIYLVQSLY